MGVMGAAGFPTAAAAAAGDAEFTAGAQETEEPLPVIAAVSALEEFFAAGP